MATKTFTTKNDRVRFGDGTSFVNWTIWIGETLRDDMAGGSVSNPISFSGASSGGQNGLLRIRASPSIDLFEASLISKGAMHLMVSGFT